jgi:DNA-binding FrmR family transcriptional regulator
MRARREQSPASAHARGQLDGILRMVDDDPLLHRHLQQIMATEAILRK